uniref:Cochlin n=1 Tax=Paramormyrops kingsleyae TaxID=1676925 RepID=A0A3B3QAY2_9TELE
MRGLVPTSLFVAVFLSCHSETKHSHQKSKRPDRAVPSLACDIRAGKISHTEFIARCPANCTQTKQPVYGTDVYASISSVCNAAIHGGIITDAGGKVIVRKMVGQDFYKGSFSNGVRSLSLPKWRESFTITAGKSKKGVLYPHTLHYISAHSTAVKTAQVLKNQSKGHQLTTAQPMRTSAALSSTASESSTTPTSTNTPTSKPRLMDHRHRVAGMPQVGAQRIDLDQGVHRPDPRATFWRPLGTAHVSAFPGRDRPPAAYPHSDWQAWSRQTSDAIHPVPESSYTWKGARMLERDGFTEQQQALLPKDPEPGPSGDPNCKVDIAFLMDGSWSIGRRRFRIQKDFLAKVAETIDVGASGPLMGIIQFGDNPETEFDLKAYTSSRDLSAAIENISQKGGASNVGKALSYLSGHFFTDAGGNRGRAPNVAVVLLDGWPTDKVEEASRQARESGINIFFVTIESPTEYEKENVLEANFMDKAVCRTNSFFSLPIFSWFDLGDAVQPLARRLCDTDQLVCSKTCLNANDIAFIIDGSSSIGTGNFRTMLQFVANVTREFEISDTDTRVGAVQYTYEQRLEFSFRQHSTKPAVLAAIEGISYWSGGTSTGAAIAYAAEQLFSQSKPSKRKVMIVITDGRSYDDVRAPALAIQRQGVIAYSIGIAWAVQEELEYIASDPDMEHSFFVDDFDNLHKFVPKIISNICQEFNQQPRN